jgi:hypothetical protein
MGSDVFGPGDTLQPHATGSAKYYAGIFFISFATLLLE